MYDSIVNFVRNNALLSIIVFSFLITLSFTLVSKKFTNQSRLKELKDKSALLRKKAEEYKSNPEKLMEVNKEMMEMSGEQLKITMKTSLITIIPFILIFSFLKNLFQDAGINNIIYWGTDLPLIHDGAGWLLLYIVSSIIFSIILRKIMKVY